MGKILAALSGGLDSAAAAYLLKRDGNDVTGITFRLTEDAGSVREAAGTADRLRIPLLTVDLRETFRREVIGYFAESYLKGETPAPCTRCNSLIKWKTLLAYARKGGYEGIATGHYARITVCNGLFYITSGVDPVKDQSYYLWDLGQEVLQKAVFPLDALRKSEVRSLMAGAGFENPASRPESMGVCFLKGRSYADFLLSRFPESGSFANGEIQDRHGKRLGTHRGYPFYTVGQKRGLTLDVPGNYQIISVDPVHNRLIAGSRADLYMGRLVLKDTRIVSPEEFFGSTALEVRIRGIGLNPHGYCRVRTLAGNRLEVLLSEPAFAPAPGQPAVFRIGDRIVGGGWIESAS